MSCQQQNEVESYCRARDLPTDWDSLCGDNYALQRTFLDLMEQGNPSDQRYYAFRDANGRLDSILMSYHCRKCNILMFTPFTCRMDTTFVHVPLSIAQPGYVIGSATRDRVEHFLREMQGLTIILNAPSDARIEGFAPCLTCSNIVLRLRWNCFDDYLASMRSHYRRRVNTALKKGADLRFRWLDDNQQFDDRLYTLYERVQGRSRIKVEKLQPAFFRAAMSKIMVCETRGASVGFIQVIENGEELIFAFVGLDYATNSACDTYVNLLLQMVKYGIARGFKRIDLGQTAEDAKMRLGGEFRTLRALTRHSNPMVNRLIQTISGWISYRQPTTHYRVFREEAEPT